MTATVLCCVAVFSAWSHYLITESYQVRFHLRKSMLSTPNHLLVINVCGNGFQDYLIRYLQHTWGEADVLEISHLFLDLLGDLLSFNLEQSPSVSFHKQLRMGLQWYQPSPSALVGEICSVTKSYKITFFWFYSVNMIVLLMISLTTDE